MKSNQNKKIKKSQKNKDIETHIKWGLCTKKITGYKSIRFYEFITI